MAGSAELSHDLLLALLALQNGMITRDQLVAAVAAWTVGAKGTLAEHLLEQGALRVDHQRLLDALAQTCLERHEGDATRTLTELHVDQATIDMLRRTGGTKLGESLLHVGVGSTEPDDRSTATFRHVGEVTSAGGRFIRPRYHARGGQGIVDIALDNELNREVALKRIQDRYENDPDARRRFVLEAEITGGLEHPGIVPVYGLGTYDNGHPYYAMRFIRGRELEKEILEYHAQRNSAAGAFARSLNLHKLLKRFTDVCLAIEYAHVRRVLHRDIKPKNVMLGCFGETLVLDWGLAKPIDLGESADADVEQPLRPRSASGEAATIEGTRVGTPEYMSPEQARGDGKVMGTRSDVYSLGAVLYSILTGKPPYQRADGEANEELLARVAEGGFIRPGRRDASVDARLERICLTALAFKPEDRYASARALADDVECWLADEPVSVYPESRGERLARWARRHRAWVRSAAASLVVVTCVSIAAAALIGRAYANERKARDAERTAKVEAEAHFATARTVTNDLYDAASKELPILNRSEELRSRLALKTRDAFEGFLQRRPRDPTVRREAAAAQRELGNVSRIFMKFERSLDGHTRAVALFQTLVDGAPNEPKPLADLMLAETDRAHLLLQWGRLAEAREASQASLARCPKLREFASAHPDAATAEACTLAEAYVLTFRSALLVELGREAEAVELAEKAVTRAEELGGRDPSSRNPALRILATAQLGQAQRRLGQRAAAVKSIGHALEMAQDLRKKRPNDPDFRMIEGVIRIEQGESTSSDAAIATYQAAIRIFAELRQEHPKILGHAVNQALALDGQGRARLEMKSLSQARTDSDAARTLLQTLCDAMPASIPEQPRLRTALGEALIHLAQVAHGESRDGLARAHYAAAIAQLDRASKDSPESARIPTHTDRARNELKALGD